MVAQCPACAGGLRVTHTFACEGSGRAQRAVCEHCWIVYTRVVRSVVYQVRSRGDGARAALRRMEREQAQDLKSSTGSQP